MNVKKNESLYINELLEAVYKGLKNKFPCIEITFENTIRVEIADDSDYHRNRTGYLCYKEVLFIKNKDKAFILGRGTKCGSYPGDEFSGDIMLLEVPLIIESSQSSEIISRMSSSSYFRNSLIIGMSNGTLGTNSKGKMAGFSMPSDFHDFVAQDVKTKSGVVFMDLRSVPSQVAKYKPGLIDVLVNAIREFVLAL